MSKQIYHLHAEVCKTLANEKRLEILDILREKEMSVSEIISKMGISKANMSQHFTILRNAGILIKRREGVTICYRIANRKVIKAFDLMREVLLDRHSQKDKILKSVI